MEQNLKERLVGAAVLVLAGVLLIPLLLDGPEPKDPGPVGLELPAEGNQTHTIRLGSESAARETPSSGVIRRQSQPAAKRPEAPGAESSRSSSRSAAAEPVPTAPGSEPSRKTEPEPTPKVADAEQQKPATRQPDVPVHSVTPAEGEWAVQVGAFGNKANAEGLRRKLDAGGYSSFVVPLERGGKILDCVRVGPVADIDAARALAARLKSDGHGGVVVRNTD